MDKIVYFDYCAFMILSALLFSTVFRKMTKGRVNRMFLILTFTCIITCLTDISAISFDRYCEMAIGWKYFIHTAYLILHNCTAVLYIYYFFALTDTFHKFTENAKRILLLWAPLLICIILLLVVNPFYHIIFYISETGKYTRGPYFFVLYIVAMIYMVFGITYLVVHKKLFNTRRFISLISVFPLTIIAVAIQFYYPAYVMEMFANALCLLFISMMVQRPEDTLDTDTGLNNLMAYVDDLNRASVSDKPVDIILINVTNYSSLHDMLTYDNMWQLLQKVSAKMTQVNEEQHLDAMLYYLGDGKFRFVIEKHHFKQTEHIAEMLNERMKQDFTMNQMEMNLLSCVCVVHFSEDICDVDSLLAFGNDLDAKFYTGRVLYARDIFKKEHYDIMRDMDRIIENAFVHHKFEVYYQPIYSIEEKRFNSAEALLRLKDDKYGFISPELFIPVAERNGAIHKIGDYVLEEVCKFISGEEYHKLNLDYIEVNLSVAQCMQNNLAYRIMEILKKYQVKPSQINLEITETAASYSQNAMMDNIDVLSSEGIHFSLDDFGTGYSNMRRIATMPFHLVKLDKTFTEMNRNPNLLIVLKNTIKMIKEMNMKIVVEGVENEELVKIFSDLDCEFIQGYYYSRPIPKDEFVAFIEQQQA